MDELIDNMQGLQIAKNQDIIDYVRNLDIQQFQKDYLMHLIENDKHTDYLTIYNILVENNIELPPLF